MTQQVVLARTTLQTLDPTSDPCSFSLHFEATGTNESVDTSSLGPAIAGFLNNVPGGGIQHIRDYLSPEVSVASNAGMVEFYDITSVLGGGAMGSPIDIYMFTLAGTGGTSEPTGCAACVEYRADYGTDVEFGPGGTRPRSRDRNRFYFGPLSDVAIDRDTDTHRPKLKTTFISDMQKALSDLSLLNTTEPNQISLVVWSRKNAGVKHAKYCVMDDRIDYQRRRSDPNPVSRSIANLSD